MKVIELEKVDKTLEVLRGLFFRKIDEYTEVQSELPKGARTITKIAVNEIDSPMHYINGKPKRFRKGLIRVIAYKLKSKLFTGEYDIMVQIEYKNASGVVKKYESDAGFAVGEDLNIERFTIKSFLGSTATLSELIYMFEHEGELMSEIISLTFLQEHKLLVTENKKGIESSKNIWRLKTIIQEMVSETLDYMLSMG